MSKPVALIPLRAGGKRVGLIDGLDKERALLGKHPLMAYTIRAAIDSGVFGAVVAVTASEAHAAIAEEYGAEVPFKRPAYTTKDNSPDIEWVEWIMSKIDFDAFAILRVTSPFRTALDIEAAWTTFQATLGADSLRTVTPVTEHPGKMWVIRQGALLPLLPMGPPANPWHSSATQGLFDCYKQTAGMEFAWTDMMKKTGTIAGSYIVPFVLKGLAALDINTKYDWFKAEQAVKHGLVPLPESLV